MKSGVLDAEEDGACVWGCGEGGEGACCRGIGRADGADDGVVGAGEVGFEEGEADSWDVLVSVSSNCELELVGCRPLVTPVMRTLVVAGVDMVIDLRARHLND